MTCRPTSAALVLGLLLMPVTAFAQGAAPSAVTLTLDEAVTRAVDTSHRLPQS